MGSRGWFREAKDRGRLPRVKRRLYRSGEVVILGGQMVRVGVVEQVGAGEERWYI